MVSRDPPPLLGLREGRLENGTHSPGEVQFRILPFSPLPWNFNRRLGSERGQKPVQEPGQAGTVPSSHRAQTAKARRGRGEGGAGTPVPKLGGGGWRWSMREAMAWFTEPTLPKLEAWGRLGPVPSWDEDPPLFWRVQEEFLATPPRGQVLTTLLDQLP